MKFLPFPCIRPVPHRAAEVACDPYDVFSREEAAAYVQAHPQAFLGIDRPETQFDPTYDMYAPEVYQRASEILQRQIDEGIFLEDSSMSYYVYELTRNGKAQTGLVGVCSLDDYDTGVIRRHEATRPEKLQDRTQHIKALGCQTGPIFLAYRDQPVLTMILNAVKAGAPLEVFCDAQGVTHRVWHIRRQESIDAIREMFVHIPCAYIADGHHRAASAVAAGHELRAQAIENGTYTGREPFNYVLSVLFAASELTILPYNRFIHDRAGLSTEQLIAGIEQAGFYVEPTTCPVQPRHKTEIGMCSEHGWYLIKPHETLCESIAQDNEVDRLDVSVLHRFILAPLLGIGDEREDPRISFIGGSRGLDELETRTAKDGVAFALYPTSIDQLLDVADAGLLMPPKSTWFEPKLKSGLFIHRIMPKA